MKRRVFIHDSPKWPAGATALMVKRIPPGTVFEWEGKTYYIGRGGELRRLYK